MSYKSAEVKSKPYRSCVRSHLKYCIQFWAPINVKDEDMLEGVQRKATEMIPILRNLSYEERLKRMGIFSLRRKRLRGVMIGMLKMIRGIDEANLEKLFLYRRGWKSKKTQFKFKNQKANKLKYYIEYFHWESY